MSFHPLLRHVSNFEYPVSYVTFNADTFLARHPNGRAHSRPGALP